MKKNQIFTIPNLLSLLRLAMIPLLLWLYLEKQDYGWTAFILILSAATDIVDGIIARSFNMVSDFGKALDPVADKLTQIAMLFCLVSRFSNLLILLILLIVKEVISGIMSLMAIRKTGKVYGADWHGKVTTVLLYSIMGLHILWYNIPYVVSNVLILLCSIMMLYSMIQYWKRNWKTLKGENDRKLRKE